MSRIHDAATLAPAPSLTAADLNAWAVTIRSASEEPARTPEDVFLDVPVQLDAMIQCLLASEGLHAIEQASPILRALALLRLDVGRCLDALEGRAGVGH